MALKAAASRSGVVLAFNASHAALNSAFAASRSSLADPIGRPPGRWAVTFQIQMLGDRSLTNEAPRSPTGNYPRLDSVGYLGGGAFDHFDRRGTAPRALYSCANFDTGRLGLHHQSLGGRRVRRRQVRRLWPAFDYPAEATARAAALKQCKGNCTAVSMNRACAALSVDMTNPCGPHGYAVKPEISSSLNAATKKCYEFGGKECVIRAWACDAKG